MKKKTLLIFAALLIFVSSRGQDSIVKPKLLLRPFMVTGINFPRSETLKQNYGTQSLFSWGAGIQLGNSDKFDVIPIASYTMSQFTIENQGGIIQDADTSLKIRCITAGLLFPVIRAEKTCLFFFTGYNYSKISESFSSISANSHGLQTGIGIERKIAGNFRLYWEISYLYQKTNKTGFRDFDLTRFTLRLLI